MRSRASVLASSRMLRDCVSVVMKEPPAGGLRFVYPRPLVSIVDMEDHRADMQIDVMLFDGFDELDALGPFEVLVNASFDVALVSLGGARQVTGSHGATVSATSGLRGADVIVVPGRRMERSLTAGRSGRGRVRCDRHRHRGGARGWRDAGVGLHRRNDPGRRRTARRPPGDHPPRGDRGPPCSRGRGDRCACRRRRRHPQRRGSDLGNRPRPLARRARARRRARPRRSPATWSTTGEARSTSPALPPEIRHPRVCGWPPVGHNPDPWHARSGPGPSRSASSPFP